jgi:phosphoenolpyruvate carboxykinase (GTP)
MQRGNKLFRNGLGSNFSKIVPSQTDRTRDCMSDSNFGTRNTENQATISWVERMAQICQPEQVFWCDGSLPEKDFLTGLAVDRGVIIRLDQQKWPGCYYHRSEPNDVARVEQCTYICTPSADEAGPTNNWAAPAEMYSKLYSLAQGSMRGRTMFVVPYLMGPPGSSLAKIGIELTDSIYVVLSMRIMTRMGDIAYRQLGAEQDFNRGLHCMLDVSPERRYIAHFPQDNTIISVGSNYGGNVLLGKKCLSLRIGSYLGRQEGWMAEHMLILGVEDPNGEKTYVAAAFPSACGKTNFAMLIPPKRFAGWKVWTVGDDIAWMRPGVDGRLYAINPENGYFGVAPGTSYRSNPNAMESIKRDTIFTNVAHTVERDIWWEGKDNPPPENLLDWRGQPWSSSSGEKAAHPNSRFCSPMTNNPALDPRVDDPEGVPIHGVIFGGRRSTVIPLVFQAFNWIHGVYVGATMGSETTAAAAGAVGQTRRDPMAMLPFCGYNMGAYFGHWLKMRKIIKKPPKIFHVNWFRKDRDGQFLWPGFGDNMRVLKWMVDRCRGRVGADETPLGWMPAASDIDLEGLDYDRARLEEALSIDVAEWKKEVLAQDDLFLRLHSDLPLELHYQRELLISRL